MKNRIPFFPGYNVIVFGLVGLFGSARANEDFTRWPVLVNPFESTGGGGVKIDGYQPVIEGKLCRTDFSVILPGEAKASIFSVVEFDAVPEQGGILCTNGRWRTKDGKDSGTTPFRVYIKDGIVRRPPG